MCFGSKNDTEDDPVAPRPHQNNNVNESRQSNDKMNYQGGNQYAPPPGPPPGRQHQGQDYAPPSGPPPGQQQQQYAPPSGPPPGSHHQEQDYAPPSGPPPGQQQYAAPSGPLPGQQQYAPPSGPPPGQQQYAPPSGPPPSHSDYAPPSGPPPSHSKQDYAAPPGPPPSQDWAAPPKEPYPTKSEHDWESLVPDTSLFPPPPAIFSGHDVSHSTNATEDEAEAGEDWCEQNPLTRPMAPAQANDPVMVNALQQKNIRVMEPAGFNGKLSWISPGQWSVYTHKHSPDRCLISYPPLYSVSLHDPSVHNVPKTIYYEVKLLRESKNNSIAMGFTALPYPSFRMPGWHRGSLAVHGDDGHKYINDRWGGKDFTDEFRKGETLGIGMTISPGQQQHRPNVNIFFTKEGRVTGLEGFHDLCCAVGTYDSVAIEVIFDPAKWKFSPQGLNI